MGQKRGGICPRNLYVDHTFVEVYAGLAHTLRVLYLDASSAKYAGSQDKKRMLDQLCDGIASLPIDQCVHLLKVRLQTAPSERHDKPCWSRSAWRMPDPLLCMGCLSLGAHVISILCDT